MPEEYQPLAEFIPEDLETDGYLLPLTAATSEQESPALLPGVQLVYRTADGSTILFGEDRGGAVGASMQNPDNGQWVTLTSTCERPAYCADSVLAEIVYRRATRLLIGDQLGWTMFGYSDEEEVTFHSAFQFTTVYGTYQVEYGHSERTFQGWSYADHARQMIEPEELAEALATVSDLELSELLQKQTDAMLADARLPEKYQRLLSITAPQLRENVKPRTLGR